MFQPITYESAVDSNGNRKQQLSNLLLTGISTLKGLETCDHGKLYASYSYASSTYTFQLFADVARTSLVATGTSSAAGMMSIVQYNGSGVSGSINLIPGTVVNDSNIEVVVLLSQDTDIPMNYLESVSDFDPQKGFADFHRQSFEYIKQIIVSRSESLIWNPNLVDSKSINGGVGGFDPSIILNWQSADLREASAQYVLYLITRKQIVSNDSVFAKRAECAKQRVTALLQGAELQYDPMYQRVPSKTRNLSTFKISRA